MTNPTETLIQREFQSHDRNPNVNGSARLLTVTRTGQYVRMVVSGVQGTAATLVTVSDATVPWHVWIEWSSTILETLERGDQ